MDSQKKYSQQFSFEFFPPKSEEGQKKLIDTARRLKKYCPLYFSVTFGAGGSTRDRTLETVLSIAEATGIPVAPHLSCIGSTKQQLLTLLNQYRDHNIQRLVALRGDRPSGDVAKSDLNFAHELVRFIRAHTKDHFHIEVAAYPEFHPEAASPQADIENLKKKLDAGADGAITQYFYHAEAYFRFVDACQRAQIDLPIVPGIMPILNFAQLNRFSTACGADIPMWLAKRLQAYGDDLDSQQALGVDVVCDLSAQLLASGAPGLHFYSMNQAPVLEQICSRLGIPESNS
jgi:methylenetetrahydrofolate reductase (NADH)